MLPPSPSQRPTNRVRTTGTVREKRKRVDISGSLMLDTGARQSRDGNMPPRPEGFGARDGITRNGGRKVVQVGAGTLSGEKRPKKKRQVRPAGPPKSHTAISPTTHPDGNSGAEIIVLDDDVKVEPVEANDPATASDRITLSDNYNAEMNTTTQIPESHQRRGTFQVHMDQTVKHHALQWKDSNRRIGVRLDPPNERVGVSSLRSGEEGWRVSDQGSGSHRSGVSTNGVPKKKRSENDGHIVEILSQQPNSRTTTMPFSVTPMPQEQEQSSTGEHRLLVALTTLTTEKQALERKLHETIISLKTQAIRAETSERKNTELESQAQTSKDNISGLKKKMMGFQKFVDGLGKDYNMLNEKNSQLNNRLNEVSQDRDALFRSLQDVRFLAEKVDGAVQGWGSSRAALGGANREIEKRGSGFGFRISQT